MSPRFQGISASYLQTPRINFAGRFRADVSTINNYDFNYRLSEIDQRPQIFNYWNPRGTGTWAMIDCVTTSVVYTNELGEVTSSIEDSAVGLRLVNNPKRAFAKLVDVDPDQQQSSTIYGMDLGVYRDPGKGEHQVNVFIGDFVPAVITRDLWKRQIVDPKESLQQPLASHSISRIENITWSTNLTSPIFQEFREMNKPLSIMFSVYNYTRPPTEDLFTYGNLVGSIGIAEEGESLSFPENGVMIPLPVDDIILSDDNPCNGTTDWISTTYFDIQGSKMTIDFCNSFKIDVHGDICHFYPLYVGIPIAQTETSPQMSRSKVEIVGEIPYMEENWYERTSGISEFNLTDCQEQSINSSEVVVVMLYNKSTQDLAPLSEVEGVIGDIYPICDFNSSSRTEHIFDMICIRIILKENPCLVTPMDYQVHRMEMNDNVTVALKVRNYGRKPENAMKIKLIDKSKTKAKQPHHAAYLDYNSTEETDPQTGIAKFHFIAGNVSGSRHDMRIDGQLFKFGYCSAAQSCMDDGNECHCPINPGNVLVFLVWSPIQNKKQYFWDDDVQPILQQYENLYPVMRNILKLGDYHDVIKPRNIHLLNLSISLDINHPSYMPVTRDLSPSKKSMILEWLNTHNHPRNWADVEQKLFESPDYCNSTVYAVTDPYMYTYVDGSTEMQSHDFCDQVFTESEAKKKLKKISQIPTVPVDIKDKLASRSLAGSDITDQFLKIATPPLTLDLPLWADMKRTDQCTLDKLKKSIQTAIEVEFCTIPPYMTALYSIKDGYNRFVYDTIRSVVMQEMLHLAQAANLLISIGGRPLIDNASAVYNYPTKLPGGVLPQLDVTLRKATPEHIANVFMMIEFPDVVTCHSPFHQAERVLKSLTIGKFYKSIKKCLSELVNEGKITFGHTDKQLHWPWTPHDKYNILYKIDSIHKAKMAINMIIEQGEGSGQMDPTYLKSNELAHFFKFEELACKRHLKSSHDRSYSFDGKEIKFEPEGVWPMRDNPSSKSIPKGTQVYYEAKIFHRMYRSLLRSIQTAFDGQPDAINDAVYLMESMQIQAKKLMQMEMPFIPEDHPKITCGPVFEYEWEEI